MIIDPTWSKPDGPREAVKNEDKDTPMLPMNEKKEVTSTPKGVKRVNQDGNQHEGNVKVIRINPEEQKQLEGGD